MFFMVGILPKTKMIQTIPHVCFECEQFTSFQVFVTYKVLYLFFLPVFKWNRTYVVRTMCCDATYYLNEEKGRALEAGHTINLEESDLLLISKKKVCPHCKHALTTNGTYCPHCGGQV